MRQDETRRKMPGIKEKLKPLPKQKISKYDANAQFPDTTNSLLQTGGMWKDKLTNL